MARITPLTLQIPGEKKFIEVNTKEQLIISTVGIYASKMGNDKYLPLQSAQQILYPPFEQLRRKSVGPDSRSSNNFKGLNISFTNKFTGLLSKNTSPSQFLAQR
jgi:hypothetical protein